MRYRRGCLSGKTTDLYLVLFSRYSKNSHTHRIFGQTIDEIFTKAFYVKVERLHIDSDAPLYNEIDYIVAFIPSLIVTKHARMLYYCIFAEQTKGPRRIRS